MKRLLAITGALSDEGRVRALLALRRGELCVCQIVELLNLASSTVSKHLFILKEAGLIEARKDGRWIYYRLAGKGAPPEVSRIIEWAFDSLSADRVIRQDVRNLREILKIDPEVICRQQRTANRIPTREMQKA